jgi:fucose 4-O-acetylase-like acetyltransferase
MKTMTIQRERMVWLDWMKVLAILSIIWGHFFSAGYVYLYVFSVQTFCVISGFLYKKSADWKTCLRKCFWQLFVPTVLLSTIMQLEAFLRCEAMGTPYDVSWPWFFQWLLLGHRWCMGPCWYFYTLIVMRLIMQALPERKWVYALLFIALSAGAIVLRQQDIEVSNANVNVLVCMPMFLIGVFLKELKSVANNLSNYFVESVLAVGAGVVVYLCGEYNGEVWMYLCGYGNHFVGFLVGTIAGTLMLFVLSLWLNRLPYTTMVDTLSRGSILIVGLHIIIVRRLMELPDRFMLEDLFFSLFILMAFYPLIRLVQRYTPWLMGQIR